MVFMYTYEGFPTKKPFAPVGWIKYLAGWVDEGRKFTRLNLELAVLNVLHECSTVGLRWMSMPQE
jgi:hypothetical protein